MKRMEKREPRIKWWKLKNKDFYKQVKQLEKGDRFGV